MHPCGLIPLSVVWGEVMEHLSHEFLKSDFTVTPNTRTPPDVVHRVCRGNMISLKSRKGKGT